MILSEIPSLKVAFKLIDPTKLRSEHSLPIWGPQIVGILQSKALLDVANHYIRVKNSLILSEQLKVHYAISKLDLRYLSEV